MPFVTVPSTESADYINSQKSDFQDTYYVDNLNTLGAGGGGGGGVAISNFYFPYGNPANLSVTIASGTTTPLASGLVNWSMDFNDIGLVYDTPTASAAQAWQNTTGSSLNLWVRVNMRCTGGFAVGLEFMPQTSSDASSWTNVYAPTPKYMGESTESGNAYMQMSGKVVLANGDYLRLAAQNNDYYSTTVRVHNVEFVKH